MVRVEEVSKVYRGRGGAVEALRGVSLEFSEGSFTALVGRSGCGKTTLLRLIAGLERESGGRIVRSVPRRQVGYVFQEPRLMPWLSVAENVRFAARAGGPAGDFGDADGILRTLGLADFARCLPHELSGGMAQRVALGRTLFCRPRLILMDEPFGALDWFTRRTLQADLLRLWREGGRTIVFVTHDIDEALTLAERVVVLREGRFAGTFGVDGELSAEARMELRERILAAIELGDAGSDAALPFFEGASRPRHEGGRS